MAQETSRRSGSQHAFDSVVGITEWHEREDSRLVAVVESPKSPDDCRGYLQFTISGADGARELSIDYVVKDASPQTSRHGPYETLAQAQGAAAGYARAWLYGIALEGGANVPAATGKDDYPIEVVRRAKVMNVHPERLMPHEGAGECSVCGCEPGEQHHLATHDANADLTGG